MDKNINKTFVPSVLCDLCLDKVHDGQKVCVTYHRDVIALLEEKKLQQLDPQMVRDITQSLTSSSDDPIQISDDDLFTYCKSRYINNLTDIANYSEGMDKLKSRFSEEMQQIYSDLRRLSESDKDDHASESDS